MNDIAHFGVTTSPLTQASYTVDFDVSPTNQAVKVEDDNVTFDLNGHTYTTTADSGSQVECVRPDRSTNDHGRHLEFS